MNNFQFMQNQQPQGNIQQHFNQGPGGNSNMLFKSNQHPPQNKPTYSEEDLVMFKVPSKATSSIYVDGTIATILSLNFIRNTYRCKRKRSFS